jgi:hypothetical protein
MPSTVSPPPRPNPGLPRGRPGPARKRRPVPSTVRLELRVADACQAISHRALDHKDAGDPIVAPTADPPAAPADVLAVQALVQEILIAGSVKREAARLHGELLGAEASPVEKLLVDQVVVAYLALQWEQLRAAEAPGVTVGQVSSRQKRLNEAQRRFGEAVKALAAVRKLVGKADAGARLRVFQAEGAG